MNFYNNRGQAIAYLYEETIYLFTGKPVAYIYNSSIYGFNGHHLGWFENGWILDNKSKYKYYSENSIGGPAKPTRHATPVKYARHARPAKYAKTLCWSNKEIW